MSEVRPSNPNTLSLTSQENPVIVVTSLRPKERPLSVRLQRIAEFHSSGAGRQCRKETSRRKKLMNRRAIRNRPAVDTCTTTAAVTVTAPFKAWNRSLVGPLMESNRESPTQSDHIKILYAARDIVYSDSELALLSSCSSCCVEPFGKQDRRASDLRLSGVSAESLNCTYHYDETPPKGGQCPSTSRVSTGSIENPYPYHMIHMERADDPDPPRLDEGPFPYDMAYPRPYSRVELVDGPSGIGDRYRNKSPEGFRKELPSEDVMSISEEAERKIQKPYRQVWHSLWEHQVGSSKSTKTTKRFNRLVSGKEGTPEQATSSASNIRNVDSSEREQRRGAFRPNGPMTQTRVTYRSKNLNRPWGRATYQRAPMMSARIAQRKVFPTKGDSPVGDSESLLEKRTKMRRCELTEKKSLPRVVVTTASRPATDVSPEKEEVPTPAYPKSAPANQRRGTPENFTNRLGLQGKPKLSTRPRFSVPIKASRVPMELLYKEMYSQKTDLGRKDTDIGRPRNLKYRGIPTKAPNEAERTFSNLTQDVGSGRDARLAANFGLPDRNRAVTLQNTRRLFSSPLYNRADMNVNESSPKASYSPSFDTGAECKPMPELSVHGVPPVPTPSTGLKTQQTGRFTEHGGRWKTSAANVPIVNHFYGNSSASRQSAVKWALMSNYGMESKDIVDPGSRFPAPTAGLPPLFNNDLAVPPDYLYDGHVFSDQRSTAFRFSHPDAPDVLISPPPNPQLRGDTLYVPVSEVVAPPETMLSNVSAPTVSFVSRFYGIRAPEVSVEENYIPLQPFFQPNMLLRPFMPSVDFSCLEPPPRPHPFSFITDNGQRQYGRDGLTSFSTNQQSDAESAKLPQGGKVMKPVKHLLTFSAQVPSSQRIPVKTCTCLHPQLETQDANNFYPRDPSKQTEVSNAPSEDPAKSYEIKELDLNPMERKDPVERVASPMLETFSLCETDANVKKGNTREPLSVDVMNAIEGGGRVDAVFMLDKNPDENSTPGHSVPLKGECHADVDFSRPVPIASPVVKRASVQSSDSARDFATKQNEFTASKPVYEDVNHRTYTGRKVSDVTEASADTQKPGGSPLTEVSGYDLYSTPATWNPEVEPEQTAFQPAENKTNAGKEETYDSVTIEGIVIEDISANQEISGKLKNSDVILQKNPDAELHCGDNGGKRETSYFRRISDFRPSCTDSATYPVISACQQFTSKKASLTGSCGPCQEDIFEEKRVTSLMHSGSARSRFHSLVTGLDACRHMSVQCKLSGKLSHPVNDTDSRASEAKSSKSRDEKVHRKDISVQVPVLCCQCVETEPYTAEKGVPDCRAGLTLRLMSTVVDVPPVIKTTECVATNTEDKPYEEDVLSDTDREGSRRCSVAMKQDSESRLTTGQPCTSNALNADRSSSSVSFDFSGDRKRPVVGVPLTDKQIKRLKPFFRSHCSELANVYTVAAVHSVTFSTEKGRTSPLSKDEKLRTDSNTSTEIRKDRHSPSSDDDKNYSCEHEQPGRASKQHARDRRVSFRPVRREIDIFPPTGESLHFEDKRSEHHRKPDIDESFENRKSSIVGALASKDPRQSKKSEKLSNTNGNVQLAQEGSRSPSRPTLHAAECIEVSDQAHERSGRREKCSRELLEASDNCSCENSDVDNVIALKRKPGCALCKKDLSASSKKKSILKNSKEAGGKHKSPDIPRSILQFGLSSIITPVNTSTKEQVVITDTCNSAYSEEKSQSEALSHHSREKVKYLRTLASLVALETSKQSVSSKPEKDSRFIKDDRVITIVDDHLVSSQCQKSIDKNRIIDASALINNSKRCSGNERSAVPTICLTRADSNDVNAFEDSADSVDSASKRFVEFSSDSIQPKDSLEGTRLKKASPVIDIPSRESTPLLVDTCSKQVDASPRSVACDAKQGRNIVVDPHSPHLSSSRTITKQLKEMATYGCLKDLEEGISIDHGVGGKQVLPPYVRDPVESFGSQVSSKHAYSPPSSKGCMFTAMKRYMNRQRPECLGADYWQQPADPNDGYPGFRFTDVPIQSECLPLGGRVYCKCKHLNDPTWSGEPELCRKRVPRRCTMDSKSHKYSTKVWALREISGVPETDETEIDEEFQESSSHPERGNSIIEVSSGPQNRLLWQSVLRSRHDKSKPTCLLHPDRDKSGSSERFRSIANLNNTTDDSPVLNLIGCPESTEHRRAKCPKHVITCALCDENTPSRGIRTLPPDMAFAEAVVMRYPRCASAAPKGSVSTSCRSSPRSSSAPAGEVRITHGRCWPTAHSVYKVDRGPRRLVHKHVRLLECDSFTCGRCERRKSRQKIPSQRVVHRRNDGELFLVVDDSQDDLDVDHGHNSKYSRRKSRRDRRV